MGFAFSSRKSVAMATWHVSPESFRRTSFAQRHVDHRIRTAFLYLGEVEAAFGSRVVWIQAVFNNRYSISGWWFQICFIFIPIGKIPDLTNIFQMGWNHQLDILVVFFWDSDHPHHQIEENMMILFSYIYNIFYNWQAGNIPCQQGKLFSNR